MREDSKDYFYLPQKLMLDWAKLSHCSELTWEARQGRRDKTVQVYSDRGSKSGSRQVRANRAQLLFTCPYLLIYSANI